MTLLAPGYLVAAAIAALGVVLLHFIVTREPRTQPLPTARFAPDLPAIARPRAVSPRDLLLMLLRALLVLIAGLALSQPVINPRRAAVRRIVLADHSIAAASAAETDDSVRALAVEPDSIIAFDSTSLSAAMIRALRAAAVLRGRSDSLELVIVSPGLAGQLDEATDSIRSLWPGAIRVVRTAGGAAAVLDSAVVFEGSADDPLRAAGSGQWAVGNGARLVRGVLPDTAGLAAGRVIVHWPASEEGETVGAVAAGKDVVVAPFRRGAITVPDGSLVVARWLDGRPAAFEVSAGRGCLRVVRIGIPSAGDVVLTRRFARLVARLTGPCGRQLDRTPARDERLAALRGRELPARVASGALPAPDVHRSGLTGWLLIAALALATAELVLRRRRPEPAR